MAVFLILIGPPGAGKGTQAERLETAPFIEPYQERGALLEIVGDQSMDRVTDMQKSVMSVRAIG